MYVCSNRETTIILQNDEKQRISKLNSHRHGKCCVGENLFYRNFHSVSRRYPLLRWVTSESGKVKRKRKKGEKKKEKSEKKTRESKGNKQSTRLIRTIGFRDDVHKELHRLICVRKNNTFVRTRMRRHRSDNEECR